MTSQAHEIRSDCEPADASICRVDPRMLEPSWNQRRSPASPHRLSIRARGTPPAGYAYSRRWRSCASSRPYRPRPKHVLQFIDTLAVRNGSKQRGPRRAALGLRGSALNRERRPPPGSSWLVVKRAGWGCGEGDRCCNDQSVAPGSTAGPALLGRALTAVGRLAGQPRHYSARDGPRLAPPGLPTLLALEVPGPLSGSPAARS
jgi:hypothetical protein